jgi:hypothetical protein
MDAVGICSLRRFILGYSARSVISCRPPTALRHRAFDSDASSGIGLVMLVAFLGLSWMLSRKFQHVVERS